MALRVEWVMRERCTVMRCNSRHFICHSTQTYYEINDISRRIHLDIPLVSCLLSKINEKLIFVGECRGLGYHQLVAEVSPNASLAAFLALAARQHKRSPITEQGDE